MLERSQAPRFRRSSAPCPAEVRLVARVHILASSVQWRFEILKNFGDEICGLICFCKNNCRFLQIIVAWSPAYFLTAVHQRGLHCIFIVSIVADVPTFEEMKRAMIKYEQQQQVPARFWRFPLSLLIHHVCLFFLRTLSQRQRERITALFLADCLFVHQIDFFLVERRKSSYCMSRSCSDGHPCRWDDLMMMSFVVTLQETDRGTMTSEKSEVALHGSSLVWVWVAPISSAQQRNFRML